MMEIPGIGRRSWQIQAPGGMPAHHAAESSRPQVLVVVSLVLFASTLLSRLPNVFAPLTPTILYEMLLVALIAPHLLQGFKRLNSRSRMLVVLCVCLFCLSFLHIASGPRLTSRIKYIFGAAYAFVVVSCLFAQPRYAAWVRRLHLIPAYGTILIIISQIVAQIQAGGIDMSMDRLGGNEHTSFLALLVPLCWVQMVSDRPLYRVLNGVVIVAAAGAVVVSASRGGLLCFTVAVLYAMLFLRKTRRHWVLLGSVMCIVAVGFFQEDMLYAARARTMEDPKAALHGRWPLWKAAAFFAVKQPLLGGDFRGHALQYVLKAAPESEFAESIRQGYSIQAAAHNGYLDLAADYGIPLALLLWWGYYWHLARDLFRAQRIPSQGQARAGPSPHDVTPRLPPGWAPAVSAPPASLVADAEVERQFTRAALGCLLVFCLQNISLSSYLGANSWTLWAALECHLAIVYSRGFARNQKIPLSDRSSWRTDAYQHETCAASGAALRRRI